MRLDFFLLGISLLSAFLNMYAIWKDQNANAYYTSAVTSMLKSFHNFFFASFDPGGFVSVDKPPVAFWIQTMFAAVFGVHGWSVILPQALAGVGSVLLIYTLVKPSFGKTAARIAALVFASTPIAVAVSRTNNVDTLLVFTLLLATWMLFKAVKTKQWLWSVAAFASIGVGFNIKMLQAYMVLPAFYLFYLLAFKVQWKKKLVVFVASTVTVIMVSLSWALVVDSTPSNSRPYVGSSQTNSVLELAFGYNGISRLTGMGNVTPGGGQTLDGQKPSGEGQTGNETMISYVPPQGTPSGQNGKGQSPPAIENNPPGQMGDGGGGMFNTGTAGPFRLFQSNLSGQISWLLPFALLGAVVMLIGIRRKKPLTNKQKESVFWLAWLIPGMVFFSVAGFFHQYYLIMLAPPIAVLIGAGYVELYRFYRNHQGWKKWMLPAGIFGSTVFELYILFPYKLQIGLGLPIVVGVLGTAASLIQSFIIFTRTSNIGSISPTMDTEVTPKEDTVHHSRSFRATIQKGVAVGGLLVLLAAPLFWSATPIIYGGNSMLPAAGPQNQSIGQLKDLTTKQSLGQIQGETQVQTEGQMQRQKDGQVREQIAGQSPENVNTKLLAFLTANNTGEKYLFATTNAGSAQAYIINTGKAVMAMGGFSGSDPILTVEKLKQMVANKEVRYFLSTSEGPGRGSSDVHAWIIENAKIVSQTEWQSGTNNTNSETLYDINS